LGRRDGIGFQGNLDNIRIYNRALSAAEVSQLYSEESGEPNMVLVQGGTLPAGSALANQTVSAFHIARFETTWAEWKQVRTWAAANGYDIGSDGIGSADNKPVYSVSWYSAMKWCNAKSEMEGLIPVYSANGTIYKNKEFGWLGFTSITMNSFANGYRLPLELEWEWAARGGVASNGYTYSGSNDINLVGWYNANSGGKENSVGSKAANELGIYDMSGNILEWCWDISAGPHQIRLRGGSWDNGNSASSVNYRHDAGPDARHVNLGFRYVRNATGDMVTVQGGTLPQSSQLSGQKVQAFQIGRTEVTWGEWKTVRTWAAANGYSDLATIGNGTADNHPVRNVNWYDVIKWTNAKSQMEGLAPVYSINGTTYKSGEQIPVVSLTANGYRLPAEAEWEWAARGGMSSMGYVYSGSNDANSVAWYQSNSSNGTKVVTTKLSNELEIFDMSGNVWEWCWDLYELQPTYRRVRGGGWDFVAAGCALSHRGDGADPSYRYGSSGLRLARNIGPKISISGTLPEATLNQAYAGYTFGAVGSTGDKVWSVSEGTLPPGMSFSANGTLSGTPTTAGTYTFVIRLETGGYWDELEVELEVVAPINYAEMVLVQGGTLPVGSELANQTVSAFHIARFETTWAEWKKVRTWAAANGYDIGTVGQGSADNHPVRDINWYDAVKWCNAKSQMEGLLPVYSVNGTIYRTGEIGPALLSNANGYRLPAEAEWEWAARGGAKSQGFTYSGSNDANAVAWHFWNSSGAEVNLYLGRGTWPVGQKAANELAIHDMSGNVWEWLFDVQGPFRQLRGGSMDTPSSYSLLSFRNNYTPVTRYVSFGFRYARNAIGDMVTVQGGTLPAGSGLAGQSVQAFQIGRTEVTWGEWKSVRDWAVLNGYSDLINIGAGSGDDHPVQLVSWYDVVKWSNAKSEMEGLSPVYTVNGGTTYKTGESVPTLKSGANGYRLPSEKEWEWAARGGVSSGNYTYSGSNTASDVAWTSENSEGTKAVGTKAANELCIYDMSGNVWEWCSDPIRLATDVWGPTGYLRGGDWYHPTYAVTYSYHEYLDYYANGIGFRLARNIGPKISISGTLPEATLNQAYAGYTFGAVGSTGDKVWSISEGTLPPGMSFSANGTLSGTPTTAGTYNFVIHVESGGYWDEVEVQLEVVAPRSIVKTVPSFQTLYNDTVGYKFTVGSKPIKVSALGVARGNGLNSANQVGLWDGAGKLIATATIPLTASFENGFLWQNLTATVNLSPSTSYIIAACGSNSLSEYRYSGYPELSSDVSIDGFVRNNQFGVFSFPTVVLLNGQGAVGANLKYSIETTPR
jgi:formylglycine-generating enzyme required for sulfatase activity